MRNERRIFACVLSMCLLRAGLAAVGYLAPEMLMSSLGASPDGNPQMPYTVRVWAVRDVVIAWLVMRLRHERLRLLLSVCVVIDCTDVVSAALAFIGGSFDAYHSALLAITAIVALGLEIAALALGGTMAARVPGPS